MKCSAWKKWKLVDDEMIPIEFCSNKATFLLTHKEHLADIPYCDQCAKWIIISGKIGLPLEIKKIKS